jgi:mitogen-activated protein kinase kinase kinase
MYRSGLAARSLMRLTAHFERELQRRPEENAAEMDKRYKQILDSVRVRQRKLFRFSRLLGQRFENATEYSLNLERAELQELYDALMVSEHLLVKSASLDQGVFLIASPSLYDRPRDIQSILGTSFHVDDAVEDPSNPYVLILRPEDSIYWDGKKLEVDVRVPTMDIKSGRLRIVADGSQQRLQNARHALTQVTGIHLDVLVEQRANLPRVSAELARIKRTAYKLSNTIMDSVEIIRKQTQGLQSQELIQTCFAFATEFGKRSVMYMDINRRMMNNLKLTRLALDWVSFICDDCIASDRKTFRWAVVALEFAMVMTTGQNILSISEEEYARLRAKVAGCMSLLISHFDIMGAKSTLAAQAEKQRIEAMAGQFRKLDMSRMRDDEESSKYVREQRLLQLAELDEVRKQREAERQALGRVLEDSNEADRSLTSLSSSATNVTLRWQQGQYVGGGTFGSVYAAINLDSGYLMAVKEIRLQDPQLIPTIAQQIRDEMGVLEVLDHPNVVSYYGIEVHRDKVYIFMEYCSGGSLAGLLEHGRIEDETVILVYALQMLEGLAYLHESSIVHRDIKPESKSIP